MSSQIYIISSKHSRMFLRKDLLIYILGVRNIIELLYVFFTHYSLTGYNLIKS